MSLDIYLEKVQLTTVYSTNITHNLGKMAEKAGIYKHLWRPEELGVTNAGELIEPLKAGLAALKQDPDWYRQFEPENKWGSYEGLVKVVEDYLQACAENPDATIRVWR